MYANGFFIPVFNGDREDIMAQRKMWIRRILPVIAVLVLCITAIGIPRQNVAVAADDDGLEIVDSYPYTTVTRTSVNLREKKSVGSALLKKIPAGATITVRSVSGQWAAVDYGRNSGYVKTEFIVLKKVQKIKATATPSPVPTLSPAEDAGQYIILKRGSTGSAVRALQEALIELGFLSGKADGDFGAATEKAVIAFQQMNKYPDTGLMDANIQAFLYVGTPKNAQGKETKINTLSPVPGVTMKQGNTGEAVGKLQQRLKELGYYTGSISCTYDAATKAAVLAFQKKNSLKKDGIAGAETQEAIYSDSALGPNSTPTPAPTPEPTPTPSPTPAPTYKVPEKTVQLGSEGADAKTVQRRLKDLGYYTGKLDGEFGKGSVDALKRFQKANGLTADGKAGKATYTILFSSRAKMAAEAEPTATPEATEEPEVPPTPGVDPTPTPTPTSVTITWTTLRNGSSGTAVSQLQEALISLGYMSGKPDGKFGDATEAAVKAFQKNNGLTADGAAGEATQKTLYGGKAKAAKVKATAAPTATPKTTATPKPTATAKTTDNTAVSGTYRQGDTGSGVKTLQQKLIQKGYLSGSADGIFGRVTEKAVIAFQKANNLKADGIAGSQTLATLNSSSATTANATPTPAPSKNPTGTVAGKPSASKVIYANWYTTVKAVCRSYPYVTIYDFQTGISWQGHIFSLGAHADYEPLTANDTSKMLKVFNGNTWNPRPVWVIFADGSVYMASTHSNPHGVQHTTDNSFAGHACIHFPRTQEQVTAIGPYATSHQEMIDKGWTATQAMK